MEKKKKKPIGYTEKERSSMRALIERTEPKSGDYVGSGTVTTVPKKKKMKRMQMGGMAGGRGAGMPPGLSRMDKLPPGLARMSSLPRGLTAMRGKDEITTPGFPTPKRELMGRPGFPVGKPMRPGMKGGGLARKGIGMALAAGGIVKAPARSYKDMKAGAGSGVGRIQKTKIAGRGR